MRQSLISAIAAAIGALVAGCAAAPSSNGLLSSNSASYTPPVFGSRTALSDPREQEAGKRATQGDGKVRADEGTPPPARQKLATTTEPPARTQPTVTPGPAPTPRHESVDTGRRKALDATREGDKARPAQQPAAGKRNTGESAVVATLPEGNVVEVAAGDTLLKIANRHRVSVSALMSANRLASLNVEPGQRLVIPKR